MKSINLKTVNNSLVMPKQGDANHYTETSAPVEPEVKKSVPATPLLPRHKKSATPSDKEELFMKSQDLKNLTKLQETFNRHRHSYDNGNEKHLQTENLNSNNSSQVEKVEARRIQTAQKHMSRHKATRTKSNYSQNMAQN